MVDGAQPFEAPEPLGVPQAGPRRGPGCLQGPAAGGHPGLAHTLLRAGGKLPAATQMLPCCSHARRSSGLGNPLLRNDLFRNF